MSEQEPIQQEERKEKKEQQEKTALFSQYPREKRMRYTHRIGH